MQSMGGVGKGASKGPAQNIENEWSNPSFIEEQRKIEEELRKQRQGR